MPRTFVYVALAVFAAVVAAFGYRLYQDEQHKQERAEIRFGDHRISLESADGEASTADRLGG
ncbi:hypothetical protein [Pleomorphomonas sp. PLEO]|uniref:hypothetical protein n=1 Tax=Pleomorphomonas sp. PLEO TaxID=3239306 RepID=UPI00351E5F24